ncbi:MAG: hypothetical protein WBQ76_00325 [Candidatus Korobacteraceae bacterium]
MRAALPELRTLLSIPAVDAAAAVTDLAAATAPPVSPAQPQPSPAV